LKNEPGGGSEATAAGNLLFLIYLSVDYYWYETGPGVGEKGLDPSGRLGADQREAGYASTIGFWFSFHRTVLFLFCSFGVFLACTYIALDPPLKRAKH
jgi:hypothetical protein